MVDDYDECSRCGGSGRDPGEWDGRCIWCSGTGEVRAWEPDEDDDEEGSR